MAGCVGALAGREVAMCVGYGHFFAQTLYEALGFSNDRTNEMRPPRPHTTETEHGRAHGAETTQHHEIRRLSK